MRTHVKRLVTLLFALGWTTPALGFPAIYQAWSQQYPEATADDALIAAVGTPCQVCHVGPGGGEPWNQYGFAVLSNGGFGNIPGAFFAIEGEDADGEGTSNLAEILAGALPGWCDPATPGCTNLAWTRAGVSTPATPPAGVLLDPPALSPPVADAGGPYGGIAGLRVPFDGAASSDADGTIVDWAWKFGDGYGGSGAQPVHAYAAAGTYTVHLKVTDNSGLAMRTSATVIVAEPQVDQPPSADGGGPYTGTEGVPVAMDGSASFDPDGTIVTWLWDFGDGNTGSGATVSHAYALAGTYTVTLSVTDNDGLSAQAMTTATVSEALGPGETIFRSTCQACHGDPWDGPAIDPSLFAGRRNTGARTCSINGAINGTFVFPGGVPAMQFLQGTLTPLDIQNVSDFLNSQLPVDGQRRFVTTCAGCHGLDGSGGPVGENVRGRDAQRIFDAIAEIPQMGFLSCLPDADVLAIGAYLDPLED